MRQDREYRVLYRRYGWQKPHSRVFQRRFAARRLWSKLLTPTERLDLNIIAEIKIEERWVGEWQPERRDDRS